MSGGIDKAQRRWAGHPYLLQSTSIEVETSVLLSHIVGHLLVPGQVLVAENKCQVKGGKNESWGIEEGLEEC